VLSGDLGTPDSVRDNAYHVVRFLDGGEENRIDQTAVLDGFVIRGGNADGPAPDDRGAGILCDFAAPAIRNCLITGNTAVQGAGLAAEGAAPDLDAVVVQSVFFHGNRALAFGGAAALSAPARITYSVFVENCAGQNGGAVRVATWDLSQTVLLSHCTAVANRASAGGALSVDADAAVDVRGCIFWSNEGKSGAAISCPGGPGDLLVSGCCAPTGAIEGVWNDAGENSSGDPCFRCAALPRGRDGLFGTADDGLALTAASPCIDRSLALAGDATTDAAGREMSGEQLRDAGAYEGGRNVVDIVIAAGPNGSLEGESVQTVPLGGAASPVLAVPAPGYRFVRWSGGRTGCSPVLALRALSAGLEATAHFSVQGGIIYVSTDADGQNTGRSWTDAFIDLEDALECAWEGDRVWVAKGIYTPHPDGNDTEHGNPPAFRLPPGVALYGGFTGTETRCEQRDWHLNSTILAAAGDESNGCVVRNVIGPGDPPLCRNTVLDGFTITNTNAAQHAASAVVNDNASPTIRHCLFENNLAPSGAALTNRGGAAPLLVACEFRGNHASAGWGGALLIAADARGRIERCVFRENHAVVGGALAALGAAVVRNCLFLDNEADSGTGADHFWRFSGSSEVTNCTFAGYAGGTHVAVSYSPVRIVNSLLYGPARSLDIQGENCSVTYCNLTGECPGETNSNAAPVFTSKNNPQGADGRFGTADDGYHLLAGSPGIDDADGPSAPQHDITGEPRTRGTAPDRGAYETVGTAGESCLKAVEPPAVSLMPPDGKNCAFTCSSGVWENAQGQLVEPQYSYQWQHLVDTELQVVDDIPGAFGTLCSLRYDSGVRWLRVRVKARTTDDGICDTGLAWSAWHPAGVIELPIRVGSDTQNVLVAGLHPQATPEFDPDFDRVADIPDGPMPLAFFTGVSDPESGFPVTTDIRACRLPVTWTVAVWTDAFERLAVHWEPVRLGAQLPPGVGLTIQPFTARLAAAPPVNMLEKSDLDVAQGQHLRIVLGASAELSCRLEKGWNLVGVPVAVDATWCNLFTRTDGTSAIEGPVWMSAGNAYVPIPNDETVTSGLGCWVFNPAAPLVVTLAGIRLPGDEVDSSIPRSWNLAVPRSMCPADTIGSGLTSVWAWDAHRQRYRRTGPSEHLTPGTAYWWFDAPQP
jgi:hypothetical protein